MTEDTSAATRQTKTTDADGAGLDATPIFFERRRYRRHHVGGRVTAVVTGSDLGENLKRRICSLQLADLSPAGVGAMVQEPLPIGASVTVFCPPHGPESGFDLTGTIVRCEPRDWGYRLGIQVEARMAA